MLTCVVNCIVLREETTMSSASDKSLLVSVLGDGTTHATLSPFLPFCVLSVTAVTSVKTGSCSLLSCSFWVDFQ